MNQLSSFIVMLIMAFGINIAKAYSDLSLFDLKGPVKSIEMNQTDGPDIGFGIFMDNHSFNFSRDGAWKATDAYINMGMGTATHFSISRDNSGRIIRMSAISEDKWPIIEIDFDWHGDEVYFLRYFFDAESEGKSESSTKFEYDNAGNVKYMDYKSEDYGEYAKEYLSVSIDNVKFDYYGNWTSRVLTLSGYWIADDTKTKINKKITQTRVIKYW